MGSRGLNESQKEDVSPEDKDGVDESETLFNCRWTEQSQA
jgi:hypothetical protein